MATSVVDVAFALRGRTIPADHGWQLYRLLAARLDWLDSEATAGVHPIRASRTGADLLHVGSRGRLMLRLPQERIEQAVALSGARLELGEGIELGPAIVRQLFAHATLYSHFVCAGAADELAFQRIVGEELQSAGIGCKVILGKARRARGGEGWIEGFSVMLHELSPGHSLKMQETGLGAARKLGCGIFTPHRSAAAIGA